MLRHYFCAAIACASFLFLLLAAAGCSVNQSMVIKGDGSGEAALRVEISQVLRDYFTNLADISGEKKTGKDSGLFDLNVIRKSLESRKGVTVKRLAEPTPDSLELDVAFDSVKDAFAADAASRVPPVVVFSRDGDRKTLALHLDKRNYQELAVLFPALSDPVFAGMGPQPNENVTDDEYEQMIEFSLGERGPPLLKKSFVTLTVTPEGRILSQSGGRLSDGSVVFKIPLIRILVLDRPLDYSVTFK
jgi:hypothetical protein